MTVVLTTSLNWIDSASLYEWFGLLALYLPLLPLLCGFNGGPGCSVFERPSL